MMLPYRREGGLKVSWCFYTWREGTVTVGLSFADDRILARGWIEGEWVYRMMLLYMARGCTEGGFVVR